MGSELERMLAFESDMVDVCGFRSIGGLVEERLVVGEWMSRSWRFRAEGCPH